MALWRIRATVDDRPGYLSVLTASLALRSVNILAVQVHTTEAGAVDDFLVDAPDSMTEAELLAAIAKGRGRDAYVSRAEAQGLVDQPTRALALAGRLVHEPDALGEALVALLDATEVRWRPEPLAGRPGYDAGRMSLADPAGGSFEVLRHMPAFTPAEYARAQALVELSGAMARRQDEQTTLLLPDGAELVIRTATMDDLEALRGLHDRSSTGVPGRRAPSDSRLARLLEPAGAGRTLIALTGDRVVAMANLLAEGDLAEVAILVDDDWQRRGIGTALLRRMLAHAERVRFAAVIAHTAADNVAMLRTLRRLGAGPADRDGAMVSVTLPVPGDRPVNVRVTDRS
ncbi:GNAT family N-acetyltransferase [Actinoplanes bogorensis]|uniref:GNAT family N-acetyltransferase n=1 Tax=Paractinoplanes bogorensis TaxID=1610840 RepID=A0ABS5YGD1_9ACTN|nr:GNAT family N-acetyltransferase [Actinoplanes bogorensis]MBU2662423.1 GNAT family N-acetyltransferase [Actinoplanes bogorensis]